MKLISVFLLLAWHSYAQRFINVSLVTATGEIAQTPLFFFETNGNPELITKAQLKQIQNPSARLEVKAENLIFAFQQTDGSFVYKYIRGANGYSSKLIFYTQSPVISSRIIELRFYNSRKIPVSTEFFWFETDFPKEINEDALREETQSIRIPMSEQYLKIAYRMNEKQIGWITIDCHESKVYNIIIDSVFNEKCFSNCIPYSNPSPSSNIKNITPSQKYIY